MPKKLQNPDEFYEAYKQHINNKAVGEIHSYLMKMNNTTVTLRTLSNWKKKYLEFDGAHEEKYPDMDKPWLWDKCDEYGRHGIPTEIATSLQMTVFYRELYIQKYGENPSVREIKYMTLLNAMCPSAWNDDELITNARKFASTEFCVSRGELTEQDLNKVRAEVDATIARVVKRQEPIEIPDRVIQAMRGGRQ